MSKEALQSVIGRAVTDAQFRNTLFANPESALAGYDLTPAEITSLKAIDAETLDQMAGDLDDRMSKVSLPMIDSLINAAQGAKFAADDLGASADSGQVSADDVGASLDHRVSADDVGAAMDRSGPAIQGGVSADDLGASMDSRISADDLGAAMDSRS